MCLITEPSLLICLLPWTPPGSQPPPASPDKAEGEEVYGPSLEKKT